jgi:hypothetical protein
MSVFNKSFFESGCDIIPLVNQADADTDITGDWVKLTNYSRALVVLAKYGTEDVDDLGLQFLQGTDATGSGSKALTASRYWYKTGVLTAQTVWTAGVHSTAADGLAFGSSVPTGFTRTVADVNTSALLLAVDIMATDLDIDGGFDWFTVFIEGDNVNNACLVSAWAILQGGRFAQTTPLSAIS